MLKYKIVIAYKGCVPHMLRIRGASVPPPPSPAPLVLTPVSHGCEKLQEGGTVSTQSPPISIVARFLCAYAHVDNTQTLRIPEEAAVMYAQ